MSESKRPLKVFLCHAHADRIAVRALYLRLKREGVDAWLDKEKLLPGSDWELEIRKAVRDADVVVVCLSKQFNQAGFRQKEVRIALDTAMEQPEGEIFIIPARLEECENLESLRKWHWVDLFEDDGYQSLIRALRARAERIGATLRIRRGGQSITSRPKSKEPETRTESPASSVYISNAGMEESQSLEEKSEAAENVTREKEEREATARAESEKAEKAALDKKEFEIAERTTREKAERESAEKSALERAEREAVEKAAQRAEREKAEKVAREKQEREAMERAESEKAGKDAAEKERPENKEAKPNISQPKTSIQITYWIVGFAILVFGVGLLSLINERTKSPEPTQTSQLIITSSPAAVTETLTASTSVAETQTPQFETISSNLLDGMLVYKSSGNNNNFPEIFIADLATERQVQITDNQGFSISSEKISDNNEFVAFLFRYGDNDTEKLGIVNIDGDKIVQITNDLKVAVTNQFDWLPNNMLIFSNYDTGQIEIYDPSEEKIEALGSGTWYSLSFDRGKVAVLEPQAKSLSIGDLVNINNGLKAIDNSVSPIVDFGKSLVIKWAPDGEKFAVVTGDYYREEKMHLSLWSKDGIRDPSLSVENADHISFSWSKDSHKYAYLVGEFENSNFINALYMDSNIIDIGRSLYPTGLDILPDNNVVYGNWGYASYLVDTENLEINLIPGEPFNVRSINNDLMILGQAYSQDRGLILVDKNGFHDLEFFPFDVWSWNWLWAGDDLWLSSKNQVFDVDTNESKTLFVPDISTIIGWVPLNYYSNFSLLPTVSPPLDLGVFACNVYQLRVDRITLARRSCSCGGEICNCADYQYGGVVNEWTRDRNGVEQYFSGLGGSCYSP
jgi:hypothetical protein